SRPGSRFLRPAGGLPVQSALQQCDRPLPQGPAGAGSRRRWSRPLPLSDVDAGSCGRDRARWLRRRPGGPAGPVGGSRMSPDLVVAAKDLKQVSSARPGVRQRPAQLTAGGGVSFELEPGRTLAVGGESGCGKSTLARMVALIEKPTAGALRLAGGEGVGASREARARMRQSVQLVFQNPYGSLNPRKTIGSILAEPLAINTELNTDERRTRVDDRMRRVGLCV